MSGDEFGSALAVLRSAVDGLLEAGLDGLDAVDLASLIDAFEVQRRRLDAVDVGLLATAEQQHLAAHHCHASLADLLVHQLRLSPAEARARVRRAGDLGPRHTLTGESLDPIHPTLAAAQRTGEISTQQIDIATKALGRIPADIAYDSFGPAEHYLLKAARHENPLAMARSAAMLLDVLDPDGHKPDEQRAHTHRSFGLHRRDDGTWVPCGSLTDETGLIWQTILEALSGPAPAEGGECDPRTPEQRRHDALRDLGIRLTRSGVPTEDGSCTGHHPHPHRGSATSPTPTAPPRPDTGT